MDQKNINSLIYANFNYCPFFGTFAHVSLHKSFIFCLDLLSKPLLTWSYTVLRTHVILLSEEPSRGVLRKRCSENAQQIYKRTLTHAEV